MSKKILLEHGSGGKLSHQLINELFVKYFYNPLLALQSDSAIINLETNNIAFTTDSFVITPIFFPGGNIGKLAVCGTINDLAVAGAIPKYISASFILEEGLPLADLEEIVSSMAEEARYAGVLIVAGDTKVVEKGHCDKVFITTTGIGILEKKFNHISSGINIGCGDKIIINGPIAEHGMAIILARNFQNFKSEITSDCASLNHLIREILESDCNIKFMRDATRGGLATVLCEIALKCKVNIIVDESLIPISENVAAMCEVFGFDPLYIANEGKIVIVCDKNHTEKVLEIMHRNQYGKQAAVIGEIVKVNQYQKGNVVLNTKVGGKRIINMLSGEQIPRIC
ncbi:MAG: hydrogenase expression/formation protein HypE [Bacteroidales bacterium]|nr:hydrogenase expression/formation protein HypE [Bacteroidales bacterium]